MIDKLPETGILAYRTKKSDFQSFSIRKFYNLIKKIDIKKKSHSLNLLGSDTNGASLSLFFESAPMLYLSHFMPCFCDKPPFSKYFCSMRNKVFLCRSVTALLWLEYSPSRKNRLTCLFILIGCGNISILHFTIVTCYQVSILTIEDRLSERSDPQPYPL